ncbi:hypothetical protein OJF2_75860 [Aquisphaera giovannonii]|uniref:Uncharacterized protein n=1 Tax=Aquisphaera giovannonii TaxID=406548 RepID=A0A5B9WFF5_9BACT|nr:hypothetical protein [Aquisphaera giovannonii]QEH38974.1 hypothetical protein OJF2_75860 [Aquisphaera giovannonii]
MLYYEVGDRTGELRNRRFDEIVTPGTRDTPYFAHRTTPMPRERLVLDRYRMEDLKASATSTDAARLVDVYVEGTSLDSRESFISVSGLSGCVGLLVLQRKGDSFVRGITAHFNGGYERMSSWRKVFNALYKHGYEQTPVQPMWHAVVVTSLVTLRGEQDRVLKSFGALLQANHIFDFNTLFYFRSRGAFLVRGDGLIGEPSGRYDFIT